MALNMRIEVVQTPQPHFDFEEADAGWQRRMEGSTDERVEVFTTAGDN